MGRLQELTKSQTILVEGRGISHAEYSDEHSIRGMGYRRDTIALEDRTYSEAPQEGIPLCNNWRGIMLLSVTSKVLSRVILNIIQDRTDPLLHEEQAGFRKGKSCSSQIFTLPQMVENSSVYVNFMDFTKAFDSVHRLALLKIQSHYGIPDKVISIISMLYVHLIARVICGSSLSDKIRLETGVKQGYLLSHLRFTLSIDWVMTETTRNRKRIITWTMVVMLEDLDFADDIALLSHRRRDNQEKTSDITITGKQIGININASNTKMPKISSKSNKHTESIAKAIQVPYRPQQIFKRHKSYISRSKGPKSNFKSINRNTTEKSLGNVHKTNFLQRALTPVKVGQS